MGTSPSDGHAQGGGMYWLPEIFGAEIFWMAILLIHIKTERFRDWPKTRTMGMRVAAVWISCQKIFGTEIFGWRFH